MCNTIIKNHNLCNLCQKLYGNKFISKEQMKLEIFEYIEIWYNRKRRHAALNSATIEEFNNQINYKNTA